MIILAPRGIAISVPLSLVSSATGQWKSSPTIAAGDFQISKDFGTFANLATLPAVTPAATRQVKVDLSASEMDAARILVQAIDQTSPAEWQDTGFVVMTYGAGYLEGTIATATSTTVCTLSSDFPATTDALVDAAIEVLSGANAGLSRKVTAYTSGRVATFDAFPNSFTAGDRIRVGGVVK